MTISDIHDFIDFQTFKERGGYNTPAEKDMALDRASMWELNQLFDLYGINTKTHDGLAPFKASVDYTTDSNGAYTVPSNLNYMHLLGIDVVVNDGTVPSPYDQNRRWKVDMVNEDELSERLNSQLKQPTQTSPVGIITGVGAIQLYPKAAYAGTIKYLRRPAVPKYGYTQSGDTISYDSGTSTQLEWTEPYLSQVIFKALQFLGINLDNPQLVQQANLLTQQNV